MLATLAATFIFLDAFGLYPTDNLCADQLLPPKLCSMEDACHCITPIHECGFWLYPNAVVNHIEGDDYKVFLR